MSKRRAEVQFLLSLYRFAGPLCKLGQVPQTLMSKQIAAILSLDVVGFSELMEKDSEQTLTNLNRVLRTTVRPTLKRHGGTLVKLMGDSVLAKFRSSGEAIRAAYGIQNALSDDAVSLRAGVHVGDVSVNGSDIFGDAVNTATRLQSAAKTGNALVSRIAVDLAGGSLGERIKLKPEGSIRLKGVAQPIEAYSFESEGKGRKLPISKLKQDQSIRFTSSSDGARLAWTSCGEGPVLVKAPSWITHLDLDWNSINAGWMADLAQNNRLVRFDQRGNGLSERNVSNISLEQFVEDLKAVFDAAGINRAPLFCKSQGAAIGAAFAAKYPDYVSGLIAIGAFHQGPLVRSQPKHVELTAAMDAMALVGWDDEYPSIRDHFAAVLAPDASQHDQRVCAEVMRDMISADEFAKFREVVGRFAVTETLPKVRCPALILHASGDRLHPIEQGRDFAAAIPDSRFVALETRNHVMPSYDPAWPAALNEINMFLGSLVRNND